MCTHPAPQYVILKSMLNQFGMANAGVDREVDLVFQALADPSRRAMVDRLSRGPASVSELAQPLSMSLPAVVQHLHVLEHSGVVSSRKRGRVRTCSIQPSALGAAEGWISERRASWEQRLDRLGEYLQQSSQPNRNPDPPKKRSTK